MPRLNENYLNLKESYLFSEIAHRTAAYAKKNPEKGARIIRLGIGDVTRPLGKAVLEALHEGVDAMGKTETFHGYGPEQGYAVSLAPAFVQHADFNALYFTDSGF